MIRSHRLLRRLAGAGVAFALLAAMTVGLAGPAAAATRFNDVPRSQPFYGDITWLVRHGIADGYKDGGYHPTATVSRQAMAAFLYAFRNRSTTPAACTKAPFSDVPKDSPFCPQISWLSNQGIAQGYADGGFHPTASVSRQAMAAFMYALQHDTDAPSCSSAAFSDVPADSPFCGDIQWLASDGIAEGFADGGFHPADAVSRQAMAAFLHRLADPAPNETVSHYLRSKDPQAASVAGQADAAIDANVSGPHLHLIDVGAQEVRAPLSKANPGVWLTATNCDKTNGKPYNCIRITYAKLVSLVQAYVSGYIGAGGSKATVAVGTNNDGTWGPKTYTAAKKAADWWTEVVQPLRDSAPAGITYVAADDIEPGFSATYSQTKTWVNGYLTAAGSVSGLRLIDNGSADGCPTTIGATGGKCPPQGDGQWTQARRVALDSDPHTDVLPQIYYTVQAEQWANLALQAKGALHFAGSLTELRASGGTFSPSQGWIALWDELTAANFTPKIPAATDLDVIK